MQDHADAVAGHVEEPPRLHHLQALVHHRRRVDRHLRAHRPRRVAERLGGRDGAERGEIARAKRTAGGRQHEPLDRFRLLAREALEERRVLRIDRQNLRPRRPRRRRHERPADDEALLVGERDPLARAAPPRASTTARRPDERCHDNIGVGRGRDAIERLHPALDADAGARKASGEVARGASGSPITTTSGRNSRACASTASTLRCAARATTRRRSGKRRHTSSVCVPMEPVEPRTATRIVVGDGAGQRGEVLVGC